MDMGHTAAVEAITWAAAAAGITWVMTAIRAQAEADMEVDMIMEAEVDTEAEAEVVTAEEVDMVEATAVVAMAGMQMMDTVMIMVAVATATMAAKGQAVSSDSLVPGLANTAKKPDSCWNYSTLTAPLLRGLAREVAPPSHRVCC